MVIFCTNCCTCCSGAWIEAPQGSVKCDMQRHNLLAMHTFGHAYAENTLSSRRGSCKLFSECHFSQNRFLPLGLQDKHLDAGGVIDTVRHLTVPSPLLPISWLEGCGVLSFALRCRDIAWRLQHCFLFVQLSLTLQILLKAKILHCFFPSESLILKKKIAFFLLKCLWCRFLITWSRVQTIERPIQIQCTLTGSEVTKMTLWTKRTLNNHDQFLFFYLVGAVLRKNPRSISFRGRNVPTFFFFLLICLWQSAGVQQALSRLR